MIGEFAVGENADGYDVRTHDWAHPVSRRFQAAAGVATDYDSGLIKELWFARDRRGDGCVLMTAPTGCNLIKPEAEATRIGNR